MRQHRQVQRHQSILLPNAHYIHTHSAGYYLDSCFHCLLYKVFKRSTFFSRIIFFIKAAPIPPIFILESFSLLIPLGIIIPNMASKKDFFTFCFFVFLSTFRPQNVKNIVTRLPIAAAPLAIMNEAITLSRSPSKTIMVFPSLPTWAGTDTDPPLFSLLPHMWSRPCRLRLKYFQYVCTMQICPWKSQDLMQ